MNGAVAAGDGDDRRARGRRPRCARSGAASALAPPIWISATSPASSTAASAACSARLVGLGLAGAGDLVQRRLGAAGASSRARSSAPTPSTAVCTTISSSADAVEALRERLADAADRLLQARALALELLQPRLELARHRVELLAERGELVVALGRAPRREVAAPSALRGVEQALDLRPAASATTVSANANASTRKPTSAAPTSSEDASRPLPIERSSASSRTVVGLRRRSRRRWKPATR